MLLGKGRTSPAGWARCLLLQPLLDTLSAEHVATGNQAVAGHHQLPADQTLKLLLNQAALIVYHS